MPSEAVLAPSPSLAPSSSDGLALVLQPVILAGGSGTRLWPVSREHYPKQLIGLLEDASLLESTAHRLEALAGSTRLAPELIVVCGEDHRFMTAEQLRRAQKPAQILLEPAPRNTAPALTLAALAALDGGQDSILVVMPADHSVGDVDAFHQAVLRAAQYARDGAVVTMGIVPNRPETGYGYIKVGKPVGTEGGSALERFVEKPDLELAKQYLASGEYWWNSGIFIVRASVWMNAIESLHPEIGAACRTAYSKKTADGSFCRVDKAAFEACPSDSIDYAVMEKLGASSSLASVVVPLNAGWSDVGSWDAVWDILPKDEQGNVARGRVMFESTQSSYAQSNGRLIACVGVSNIVVIETPDAVLVADKSQVQDIKAIVARIKHEGGSEAQNHRKVQRPWGYYDSIDMGSRFQVKRIVVKPGEKLSLQMHYHRAEHWIVVSGTAEVTCGEKVLLLTENQSTYIPLGTTHRLANPGKTPLEIIEVQSGSYLGEDDIVRFDDTYGRK